MTISKAIPGFESVRVVNGGLRFSDGTECTLPVTQDNQIIFPVKDRLVLTSIEWLEDFAFHRVHLSRELLDNLQYLYFVPHKVFSKKRPIAKIPLVRKPVLIDEMYRLVPRYSRYAISECGEVLDLQTRLPVFSFLAERGYLTVNIWDTAIHEWINTPVHRMLAFAWLENDNFEENYVINHKDGIKTNNSLVNLEWTSYKNNNIHAVDNGLRSNTRKGRIRDTLTGEVSCFNSFGTAVRMMGSKKNVQYSFKANPAALWFDRYEIRLEDDKRPWFYENRPIGTKVGRYEIKVAWPNGEQKEFFDIRDMRAAFPEVKNKDGKNIWKTIAIIEKAVIGVKITAVDLHSAGREIRESIRLTGPLLRERLCIDATHNQTKQVIKFNSLHSTAKHFQVDRDVIKTRLSRGSDYNGWTFKQVNKS